MAKANSYHSKKEPEEMADDFFELGVKTVVIKLGKKGCFIKKPDGEKYFTYCFKSYFGITPRMLRESNFPGSYESDEEDDFNDEVSR